MSGFEKNFRSKKSKKIFLGLEKKFLCQEKGFFRAKKDFLGLKSLKKDF